MRIHRTHLRIAALLLALLPALPAAGAAVTVPDEGFWVVGFHDRITDHAREQLLATGMRVVDYEPADSYIVWGTRGQAAAAGALDVVQAVRPLAPERKAPAALTRRLLIPYAEVGVWARALEATRPLLEQLGGVLRIDPARADGSVLTVAMPLRGADVAGLARAPGVLFVGASTPNATPEDEATAQVQAGNIDGGGHPSPGYGAWLAGLGLDGEGITVAVVDTGVSRLHPDFDQRVTYVNYAGEPDGVDDGGHGTHVAGIVGGSPGAITSNLKDLDGFIYGQGVAPKVGIVAMNRLAVSNPPPFAEITAAALARGARMWNASWFTGSSADARAGYVANARIMDELSRDGDPTTASPEEFLLVFSAGNTGATGPTQPKEAKNIVAVGATTSGRDLLSRRAAGDTSAVAGFSSIGPTLDGRIFPTVVAPGEGVVSAAAPEGVGLVGACIPAPLSLGFYTRCSGTSMAAPHVTGAAALIHQLWLRDRGVLPSPALVKALLVNGAEDIGIPNIPNVREGWGRVDLSNVFTGPPRLTIDQAVAIGSPGDAVPYEVDVADPAAPLRVTLAWSDVPAAVGANPSLVNDLDLVVEQLDGNGDVVATWLGNVFDEGHSVAGGAADRLNNLENVFLPLPAAGRYRISVSAANLPGDGSAWNPDATDQDYALVISNVVVPEG